jgi:hypothetical protein
VAAVQRCSLVHQHGHAHHNPLKPKTRQRERERASFLLEGSQATPARPSGRNSVKVKTLW